MYRSLPEKKSISARTESLGGPRNDPATVEPNSHHATSRKLSTEGFQRASKILDQSHQKKHVLQSFPDQPKALESGLDELSSLTTKEWLTTPEAAEYLGLSAGSLLNMASSGQIPHYKLGRRNRYRVADLRKLLLAQKRGDSV